MKKIGEFNGLDVMTSPYVDKDHVYLLNPNMVTVAVKTDGFEPYNWRMKLKQYFKNLWKAIKGTSV